MVRSRRPTSKHEEGRHRRQLSADILDLGEAVAKRFATPCPSLPPPAQASPTAVGVNRPLSKPV
jgi:hypothetical protein